MSIEKNHTVYSRVTGDRASSRPLVSASWLLYRSSSLRRQHFRSILLRHASSTSHLPLRSHKSIFPLKKALSQRYYANNTIKKTRRLAILTYNIWFRLYIYQHSLVQNDTLYSFITHFLYWAKWVTRFQRQYIFYSKTGGGGGLLWNMWDDIEQGANLNVKIHIWPPSHSNFPIW